MAFSMLRVVTGISLLWFIVPGYALALMIFNVLGLLLVYSLQRLQTALPGKFGVQPPKAPAMQPWGLRTMYVYDPAGVLWHVAQRRPDAPQD